MAYTKAQMNELARVHLSKISRLELTQIVLETLYTSALDFYARNFMVFKHRDTWTGDGATYNTALPADFVASTFLRVGTGPTAPAEEVSLAVWLDQYESNLGLAGLPLYIYCIDDFEKYVRVYPVVPDTVEVQHFIYNIPVCPTTDELYFPQELELHPFIRTLRWAFWEFQDDVERADAVKLELLLLAPEVHKRASDRSLEHHRRPVTRQLG